MKNSKARELAKAATEADPRWAKVMAREGLIPGKLVIR